MILESYYFWWNIIKLKQSLYFMIYYQILEYWYYNQKSKHITVKKEHFL